VSLDLADEGYALGLSGGRANGHCQVALLVEWALLGGAVGAWVVDYYVLLWLLLCLLLRW